ncbi:MAG: hypothetical protein BWY96_03048 [Spirochaetes bacterium ADurb.BinA120]|nr:MAG: hypothetical protein BWY96_03048 [Spirochaetes bacterium ADurb.BinA120]
MAIPTGLFSNTPRKRSELSFVVLCASNSSKAISIEERRTKSPEFFIT